MSFKLWLIASPSDYDNQAPGGVTSHVLEFETKELAEIARAAVIQAEEENANFYVAAVPLYGLPI